MTTTDPSVDEPGLAPAPPRVSAPDEGARWERRANFIDDPRRKSVFLAAMLSLLPGLGQVYVGYYQHAVFNIVAVGTLMTIISQGWMRSLVPLLALLMVFVWAYNVIDAGRRAALYNQMLMGLRQMDLPENQSSPDWRGSLAGGVVLVVFGLILFSHTMFGWSLYWLEQWWPIGFVAFGGWLIYAAINKPKPAGPREAPRSGEPPSLN